MSGEYAMKARLLACLGALLAVGSMPGAAVAVDPGCADLGASFHTIGVNSWRANPASWSLDELRADGDLIYFLSEATGVGIMDVSDPRHPVALPHNMSISFLYGFDQAGSFVYEVGEYEFTIFDVSTPTAPLQVGTLALPTYATSVAVAGGRAYVSRRLGGHGVSALDVIDVTDPAAPRLVRTIDGLYGHSARIVGSRLYLLYGNLQVVDIADPDQPTLLGTWNGAGIDFDVAGDRVYVAALPADLMIVDVADAANPALVGSWSSGSENILSMGTVAVMGSHAVMGDDEALHIVDVSDPAAPFGVGRLRSLDSNRDLVVNNGLLYVADGDVSLRVVEPGNFRPVMAEAFAPTDEGIVDLSPSPEPGLCLALAGTQLRVLDHADPQAPTFVASLDLPGEPRHLVLVGDRALVACGAAGLVVVDVADPRAPVLLGAVPGVGNAMDLKAAGPLVHGTGDGGPYWVVDTSVAGMPALVGTMPTAIEAMAIAVDGPNAYLEGMGQLQALDISNPAAPASRFVQDLWWDSWYYPELVARNGLLHVLGNIGMLTLEDTGDGLRRISEAYPVGADLAFDGDLAYAPDFHTGASVVDFSNPRDAAYAGSIESAGTWYNYSNCITISGDHVIVGFEYGGLLVAPRVCGGTVPVEVASFVALRDGDGVRLRWIVPGVAASVQFRVVVRSAGGDRVMPGAVVGDGVFEARDDLAARATGAVTYVLERRDDGGAWLEIATTTYEAALVTPATRLTGCTPNPFNPNTRVEFTLAAAGHVIVAVQDAAGRQVAVLADASFGAGPQALTWNGRDDDGREMASGIYLVSLRSDAGLDRRKVMLLR
jgi:hypothetical protein